MLHIEWQQESRLAPRITTGLNTVTRTRPDGTRMAFYYDRKTGIPLGSDRDAAIAAAKSRSLHLEIPRSGRAEDPIHDHRLGLGDAGEHLAKAELMAAGFIICEPVAGAAYDFVVDDGHRFWRVQVKTRMCDNVIKASFTFATRGGKGKPLPREYHLQGIDILALVNWRERVVVFCDAKHAEGLTQISLPLTAFCRLECAAIRWAKLTKELTERATAAVAHQAPDSPQPQMEPISH